MARKDDLRRQREGTIINLTSKKQETDLGSALTTVVRVLTDQFGVVLKHEPQWKLNEVVSRLRSHFPDVDFHYHFDSSAMRPDGGVLSVVDRQGNARPVLITEVKNQVGKLVIEVSEKVLRRELSAKESQEAHIKSLVEEVKMN